MNVLIVDDEPKAREDLSRLLGGQEGYTVLEPSATNGEEALALIDSLKPDVVLLDIGMPPREPCSCFLPFQMLKNNRK